MWNMRSGMMSYGQAAVKAGVLVGEGRSGVGGEYGGPVMWPHLMPSAEYMSSLFDGIYWGHDTAYTRHKVC